MDNKANPKPDVSANSNQDPRQQVVDKLKQANNVLVTVSNNPSIDQLAACIGLTLSINKAGKHGTAVFSGEVPSTIEFLQPEDTLEKNTDSLRDFIIALDKSKADKLRYKVEDKVVKIFITPYRTSLSEKDLDFSMGDFNVDVVVALGVHKQQDLDAAITAHGRILHDATTICINNSPNGDLGSINWVDTSASSLSELAAGLDTDLGKDILDGQIATAFLTGIVAETNRFSNDKTTPQTMNVSAKLMSAGANQQLVVSKLEPPKPPEPEQPPAPPVEPPKPPEPEQPPAPPVEPPKPEEAAKNDGTLQIQHDDAPKGEAEDENKDAANQIEIDREGNIHTLEDGEQKPATPPSAVTGGSPMIQSPPQFDSKLQADVDQEGLEPSVDPLSSNAGFGSVPAPDMSTQEQKVGDSSLPPMPEQNLPQVGEPAGVAPVPDMSNPPAPEPMPPAGGAPNQPIESSVPSDLPPAPGLTTEPTLTLPPQPPLPEVRPESRPQVIEPPSTEPGSTLAQNDTNDLPTMDMPMPGAQPSDLVSSFGVEDNPSGAPSNPAGPPPPPVPPPPPTAPPVF